MLRPAKRAKSSPVGNSTRSHEKFKEACLAHGILATDNEHDNGVDFVTYSYNPETKEQVFKTVQVVRASDHKNGPHYFQVNKPLKKITDEIHIIAILIESNRYDDKTKINNNSGLSGDQDFWFLIPIDVYCHPKMYNNYTNTRTNWGINIEAKFLPPLDRAYNAWYLFDNKDLEVETNRFLNINPRKKIVKKANRK